MSAPDTEGEREGERERKGASFILNLSLNKPFFHEVFSNCDISLSTIYGNNLLSFISRMNVHCDTAMRLCPIIMKMKININSSDFPPPVPYILNICSTWSQNSVCIL